LYPSFSSNFRTVITKPELVQRDQRLILSIPILTDSKIPKISPSLIYEFQYIVRSPGFEFPLYHLHNRVPGYGLTSYT
jgi:hypothetical protein